MAGVEDESGENVVRVDFAARRQKQEQQKRDQQRVADAARSRPTSAELSPERPEKLRVFTRLVERGMVMVTLDARRDGVRVPANLAGELQLNLNFSLRFGIDDFAFDDDGVRASLSFRGTPFHCEVPWSSVYMMTSAVDAERLMWPDSLPPELAELVPPQARPSTARPPTAPQAAPVAAPTTTSRPVPVRVAPPAPDEGTGPDSGAPVAVPTTASPPDDDGGPKPPTPRPTLRRVK